MLLDRQRAGGFLPSDFLRGFHTLFHALFILFAWANVKLPHKSKHFFNLPPVLMLVSKGEGRIGLSLVTSSYVVTACYLIFPSI